MRLISKICWKDGYKYDHLLYVNIINALWGSPLCDTVFLPPTFYPPLGTDAARSFLRPAARSRWLRFGLRCNASRFTPRKPQSVPRDAVRCLRSFSLVIIVFFYLVVFFLLCKTIWIIRYRKLSFMKNPNPLLHHCTFLQGSPCAFGQGIKPMHFSDFQ